MKGWQVCLVMIVGVVAECALDFVPARLLFYFWNG